MTGSKIFRINLGLLLAILSTLLGAKAVSLADNDLASYEDIDYSGLSLPYNITQDHVPPVPAPAIIDPPYPLCPACPAPSLNCPACPAVPICPTPKPCPPCYRQRQQQHVSRMQTNGNSMDPATRRSLQNLIQKIINVEQSCHMEKRRTLTNYHGHNWEFVNGHWHYYKNSVPAQLADVSRELLRFRGTEERRNMLSPEARRLIPVMTFRLFKLHYDSCEPTVGPPCYHFGCVFGR